ncbi:MaoC/PaaZ C-terminal domain-containing protein [Actinophytocola sp.]|uniref:MaoC/PaaZ C-terminal domain-containing protein n=1 Tax=Actinophytocola sp. TaxID=1872138 RepID=UPI002ED97998
MIVFSSPRALLSQVGSRLGVSAPRSVPQQDIDAFGTLTGDRQWIHHDVSRARGGPFGGPVAHGMLSLSLVMPLLDTVFRVDGAALVLNKGLDRVRFVAPVPAGASVRLTAELMSAAVRPRGYVEAVVGVALSLADDTDVCTARVRLLYQESAWLIAS